MSDWRGNARNFEGRVIRVFGDDDKMEKFFDDLDFVVGCVVLSWDELEEPGRGKATIQARAAVSPTIIRMAGEHGLKVEA